MPYSLTWEPRGLVRRYHGDVTIDERRRSFEAICGDPRFDDLRYTITDYLEVRQYEVTPQATLEIAAFHLGPYRSNPNIRIAAVAVRADVLAAIHEFRALRIAPQPYEVFGTLHEARQWVGGAAPSRASA
jgi:hypothetical protein